MDSSAGLLHLHQSRHTAVITRPRLRLALSLLSATIQTSPQRGAGPKQRRNAAAPKRATASRATDDSAARARRRDASGASRTPSILPSGVGSPAAAPLARDNGAPLEAPPSSAVVRRRRRRGARTRGRTRRRRALGSRRAAPRRTQAERAQTASQRREEWRAKDNPTARMARQREGRRDEQDGAPTRRTARRWRIRRRRGTRKEERRRRDAPEVHQRPGHETCVFFGPMECCCAEPSAARGARPRHGDGVRGARGRSQTSGNDRGGHKSVRLARGGAAERTGGWGGCPHRCSVAAVGTPLALRHHVCLSATG